jgi:hypothetical protein
LFIGFFSAVIAITLQHNVQLPQVLMGRFRHASRAAMKMRASFNQRKGTLAQQVRKSGKQESSVRFLMADKTRRAALTGSPSIVEPWSG